MNYTEMNTRLAPQRQGWKRALARAGARARATVHGLGPNGMLLVALVALLLVSLSAAASAIVVSSQYDAVRSDAGSGLTHLQNAEALASPLLKHPALPNSATLSQFSAELNASRRDFAAARAGLTQGMWSVAGASSAGRSALALLTAADDACQAGLDLSAGLAPVSAAIQSGGFFANTATGGQATAAPGLTQAMLATLRARYESAVAHLRSAVASLRGADLGALPAGLLSAQHMSQLRALVADWPALEARLGEVDSWLGVAPALLGLGQPERLLIELMDRGEMRATGGFIGAYGVMTIAQGKIAPFTLADVFSLDVPYLDRVGVSTPPAAYRWWPFQGFGLRDSNLSADFPTSARLGMTMLGKEGGPGVQGVVALNARVIERILRVIGPVQVPGYNVTVTDKNLETMLRRYTETSAQRDGNDLPAGYQLTSIHERFTALLGQRLMAQLRAYMASEGSGALAQALWTSLTMKDIQVYLGDQTAEGLLARAGMDGAVAGSTGGSPTSATDAVTVTDTNITGNKASALTTAVYADAVTLNADGTATHHLTVTYHFSSASMPSLVHFLYGRDHLLSYLRIYTPRGARLVSASGFLNGAAPVTQSDIPWRTMWAGLARAQDGVPYSLHFIWTAPVARDQQGRYILTYQSQSGANQWLTLSITVAGASKPAVTYNGSLVRDLTFIVAR